MKTLLRCACLVLIIAIVAVQFCAGQRSYAATDSRATLASGMERLNIRLTQSSIADVFTGQEPSCPQPIRAVLLQVDGGGGQGLSDLRVGDDLIKYVYLGSVTSHRRTAVMFARWVWAKVCLPPGCVPPSQVLRSSRWCCRAHVPLSRSWTGRCCRPPIDVAASASRVRPLVEHREKRDDCLNRTCR